MTVHCIITLLCFLFFSLSILIYLSLLTLSFRYDIKNTISHANKHEGLVTFILAFKSPFKSFNIADPYSRSTWHIFLSSSYHLSPVCTNNSPLFLFYSSIFHKLNLSVEKEIGWWICNHRQGEPPSCCPKNNPGNTSKKLNDMRKFSSTYTYTHAWVCHASVNTVHHSLGAHVFRYFLHTPSHFLLLLLPHHACRGHDTIWQTNIFQPGLLRHVKTTV